ncbi:MAG: ATP-binding protein [Bacteroidales bacterium]
MNDQGKTKEELIKELQELRQENNSLKALYDKDITDCKHAEQELIIANKELAFQNEEKEKLAAELIKAEESDRLKSAFLANMSHEIRTPMNGILGFAELLKEPHLTGEEQQNYIRIIEKSGARMLNIINDIVDISKIESGLMEVNITESNINKQIEYIYTFFKPEVEGKGMQISFKNSLPSKEAIIKTDREKIYAILTNLIKNAIKYSDKGTIEFGYNLKVNSEPVELEFFVKDTGIGIAKDRQEAIFERFVQADITDKQALQGAGLGLSITKAYVEMLSGKLWVESEKGKGSVFYFTIPDNAETQAKSVITNVVSADGIMNHQIKNLKILIAEDDETSDLLITRTLKKISHEVLHVKTGVETIEACRNNPDIDLVMMDIQMPEMDGYEATRQIRQFNKDVIIIAQTAYALTGEREKALEAGCNDYISKPILKDELLALIQKYFNK